VKHDFVTAAPGTRAGFTDESNQVWYATIVGWIQNELETGEIVFRPVAIDRDFQAEATVLEDSMCFVRVLFNNENLGAEEIAEHAKSVQAELRRDAEFQEKSRAMRKQIGAALLAAHPEPRSKSELIDGGIVDDDKILLSILDSLKGGGLVEKFHGGKYGLTARGVVAAQAKAAASGKIADAS
jgi:hypothetical protein